MRNGFGQARFKTASEIREIDKLSTVSKKGNVPCSSLEQNYTMVSRDEGIREENA